MNSETKSKHNALLWEDDPVTHEGSRFHSFDTPPVATQGGNSTSWEQLGQTLEKVLAQLYGQAQLDEEDFLSRRKLVIMAILPYWKTIRSHERELFMQICNPVYQYLEISRGESNPPSLLITDMQRLIV